MKSIDRAGKLLQDGKQIILFDCGGDACLLALSGLRARFGAAPHALCDAHKDIQGERIGGLTVIAPEEALAGYPDAYWFIANFLDRASESAYLERLGIPSERIVNYALYERRLGCRYLANYSYCVCNTKELAFCCPGGDRLRSASVAWDPEKPLADCVNAFQSLRSATISQLSHGTPCDNCGYLCEGFYSLNAAVELINYSGNNSICNFNCIYCNPSRKHAESLIPFAELYAALKEQGYLSEDVHVQFSAGEIARFPNKSEMFRALEDGTVSILTNGSIFLNEIVEALHRGNAVVNISLDAGTAETYHAVKRVKAWDAVLGNLERYASTRRSNIVLKYIFLPGINDSREEVDGFLRICEDMAGLVQLSHNVFDVPGVTDVTRNAFRYMKAGLKERGLPCHVSAGSEAVLG